MGSYNYKKMFGWLNKEFKINEAGPTPAISHLFSEYSKHESHLSADQMLRFLTQFQGETNLTLSDVDKIVDRVLRLRQQSTDVTTNAFTLDDFFCYLFDDELNGPIRTEVHHDMNDPMQHYFIYTGHNSYLTGNQLSSDCSEIPIIKALERGVRAIELDIWPNPSKDNINVLHGRTLTTPIPLIKCLRSIKEHAFVKSPYPVIITLEDHLTPSLQAKAAEMLVETFGDSIYYTEAECFEELPSPESLKHRFILSTKPPVEYLETKNSKDKGSSSPLAKVKVTSPATNKLSPLPKSRVTSPAANEYSPSAKNKVTSPMEKESSLSSTNKMISPVLNEPSPSNKNKVTSLLGGKYSLSAKNKVASPVVHKSSPSAKDKATLPVAKESSPSAKNKVTSPVAQESSPSAKDKETSPVANKSSPSTKGKECSQSVGETSLMANDYFEDEECTEKHALSTSPSTEQDIIKDECDEEDEYGDDRNSGQPCVNDQYKRLIAIHAGKPKKGLRMAFKSGLQKVKRLSVSEDELEKAATSYGPDVVRFTQKHLLRVYPKGTRISSSNYKPFTAWMHGAQMVAFNMQGYGLLLWLMHGMFKANGGCGYLRKPDFLIKNGENGEVFDPRLPLPIKTTLRVKVFTGDGWRLDFSLTHFDAYSPPDFYTKVHVFGAAADFSKQKTKIIADDFAPVWDEEFSFPLTVREMALLRIVVREYDRSEKDDFGGQTCLPVSELKTGIRCVPLYDKKGKKYNSVKLLMQFNFV